eukprot:m.41857 g.41857  ORF g.41857 m.41857 type:complete len:133 (-) comp10619_c0_seq4:99-497(-)
MQLLVQGQQCHVVDVDASTTVSDLKTIVEAREGIPAEEQYLACAGRPLVAGALSCFDIAPLSTITVGARVLGGKVHGSLSRAGKVKGQTPKVEKQEKKKSKTGRAKRRQQFNSRFSNTVAGFGKKKGPNSNS